jgi:nuclear pore complex protein Nup155
VVTYLQRRSKDAVKHANLLWKYYAHFGQFFEAAQVQLQLAKSGFELNLATRIEYLSRAKANATARVNGMQDFGRVRQSRQEVLREISDLLDIASLQEDLVQRLEHDPRLSAEKKPAVINELNGRVLPLDDLYNGYADQAGYYDLSLIIYQVADYRNSADIEATWRNLVKQEHEEAEKKENMPWEAVADKVRMLGKRLNCSETTFPIRMYSPTRSSPT